MDHYMLKLVSLVVALIFSINAFAQEEVARKTYFPKAEIRPEKVPAFNNVWVLIMAGQSNMAGRGLVEPQDTLPDPRILTINSKGNIIVAKEPLHFYEPSMTGLDCGLSFAQTILKSIPDSVSILMIPTAVGGSAIDQWLGDSIHRNVKLLTNFREKIAIAQGFGQIKGIVWHQGESDSNARLIGSYEEKLRVLFGRFREYADKPDLPIVIGEIGIFTEGAEYKKMMNQAIHHFANTQPNVACVTTNDFRHKGDKLHFDSESQRMMGVRMAHAYLKLTGLHILNQQ
jgi:hypothetical protein